MFSFYILMLAFFINAMVAGFNLRGVLEYNHVGSGLFVVANSTACVIILFVMVKIIGIINV